MRTILVLHAFIAVLIFTHSAWAQEIGRVTAIEGVVIKSLPERQAALTEGSPINMHDVIMTQDGASAVITFIDNTTISLGAGTHLNIDEYVYDPENDKGNKAEFKLLKGPFHYVSGLIAKKEKPDVNLHLDFGSIGIRGTKIWRDMTMTDDGKQQCRIYIEDGKARVSNEKGFTMLKNGDGTRIIGRANPPTPSKPWGEAAIADIKSKSPAITIAEIEPEQAEEPAPEPQTEPEETAPTPEPEAAPAQETGETQDSPTEPETTPPAPE